MNYDILSEIEANEIRFLYKRYVEERSNKNYVLSDGFRTQLIGMGVNLQKQTWHPVFEDTGYRIKRVRSRDKHEGA